LLVAGYVVIPLKTPFTLWVVEKIPSDTSP